MNKRIIVTLTMAVLSTMGLTGCNSDSVSYDITDRNHSITLLRDKPYLWSKQYQQNVVIANMPECQRRYRLAPADFPSYQVLIYDADADSHVWVVQGHYYKLNHIDCSFQPIKPTQFPEEDFIGVFKEDDRGRLEFYNAKLGESSPGTRIRNSLSNRLSLD